MAGSLFSEVFSNLLFHRRCESSPLYGEIPQSGITLSVAISLISVICVSALRVVDRNAVKAALPDEVPLERDAGGRSVLPNRI